MTLRSTNDCWALKRAIIPCLKHNQQSNFWQNCWGIFFSQKMPKIRSMILHHISRVALLSAHPSLFSNLIIHVKCAPYSCIVTIMTRMPVHVGTSWTINEFQLISWRSCIDYQKTCVTCGHCLKKESMTKTSCTPAPAACFDYAQTIMYSIVCFKTKLSVSLQPQLASTSLLSSQMAKGYSCICL